MGLGVGGGWGEGGRRLKIGRQVKNYFKFVRYKLQNYLTPGSVLNLSFSSTFLCSHTHAFVLVHVLRKCC